MVQVLLVVVEVPLVGFGFVVNNSEHLGLEVHHWKFLPLLVTTQAFALDF